MNTITRRGLGLASALMMFAIAAPATHAASDAWITTKAKIALLTTDGAGRTSVKVDTDHGKITLHGKVDSQAAKEKAENAVKTIDGVTGVRNLLQVVPESREKAVKAADKDIREGVENALKRDKNLESVKVESVDNGLVILKGKTASLDYKLLAIETADAVPGVRHVVASQVESNDK